MIRITAYRCQHCGKVYLKDYACKKHEEKVCPMNPIIRPLCYSCEHYAQSMESETIYWDVAYRWFDSERYERREKDFKRNTCEHPDNYRKLYNDVKLSDDIRMALNAADFKAMPTPGTGGCRYYKPIPGHPYAEMRPLQNE